MRRLAFSGERSPQSRHFSSKTRFFGVSVYRSDNRNGFRRSSQMDDCRAFTSLGIPGSSAKKGSYCEGGTCFGNFHPARLLFISIVRGLGGYFLQLAEQKLGRGAFLFSPVSQWTCLLESWLRDEPCPACAGTFVADLSEVSSASLAPHLYRRPDAAPAPVPGRPRV